MHACHPLGSDFLSHLHTIHYHCPGLAVGKRTSACTRLLELTAASTYLAAPLLCYQPQGHPQGSAAEAPRRGLVLNGSAW